jgi:hypothetical protein
VFLLKTHGGSFFTDRSEKGNKSAKKSRNKRVFLKKGKKITPIVKKRLTNIKRRYKIVYCLIMGICAFLSKNSIPQLTEKSKRNGKKCRFFLRFRLAYEKAKNVIQRDGKPAEV